MHKLLAVAASLCFPLLAMGQTAGISCHITADKRLYKVGEQPTLAIRIKNDTDSVIRLVKVLDGSESQMRYPYSYYEVRRITASTRRQLLPVRSIRCGNMDGIDTADFVLVKPGYSFNPLENQSQVYTSGVSLAGWKLKPGTYNIVFHYSTHEPDFNQWAGDMASSWTEQESANSTPVERRVHQRLLALFAKVPKVALVSNELTIEVE